MTPESRKLFQEIDCNCNDCKFFIRDIDALNRSKKLHRKWDANRIRTLRTHYWNEAQREIEKPNKYNGLMNERSRVSVDTGYRTGLVFGNCSKFDSPIATVPNACQVNTQECFVHRRS